MIDELLLRITANTHYYHHDGLGSTIALTDSTGALVESYTYDVFGTTSILSTNLQLLATSAVGNRFLFTGREYLAEIGLYDYRNRFYSPWLGRFLQTDPIAESRGINLYRYCANSAVNFVDPQGTTYVYSNKRFPGSFDVGGFYERYFDDGSSQHKELRYLDDNKLNKDEEETFDKLQNDQPTRICEGAFDTNYFEGEGRDDRQYYLYNGTVYADNEINYYGIGMFENYMGDSFSMAKFITYAWKNLRWNTNPNDNTWYWLKKGYDDYRRISEKKHVRRIWRN
jgi:RHS repeat-associated protein